MTGSYAAICSGFYVNQRLSTRMELPLKREAVLDLFERIRKEFPRLDRFRRYRDASGSVGELALETSGKTPHDQWIALRKTSVRTGIVDPPSLPEAYKFHRSALDLAPFYLSINPLDISGLEVMLGFDLDAGGNHNDIVREALLDHSPLARLTDTHGEQPLIRLEPSVGFALSARADVQGFVEIKTRTGAREVRNNRFPESPISVLVSVRQSGSFVDPATKDLGAVFDRLAAEAEELVDSRVAPCIINPLRQAIASGSR